jgi:hypothetical protein
VVEISTIIVSYNTAHLLTKAVSALQAASDGFETEVFIVDNASSDGSVAVIQRNYPQYKLIVNDSNVGFGRANNQALSFATGQYILLLNTDAFVSPDTLRKTIAYMEANPRCGILGVRLEGRDGELQPSARYFPTPLSHFIHRTGMHRWFKNVQLVDDMGWDHSTVRHCDWVVGCFYLVRRELIEQVGLFDPRYFLYFEEVDHCFAAKRAGWDVVFYPYTTVVHLGGESAKSSGEITKNGRQISALQMESQLLFYRKNHGLGTVLLDVFLSITADFIVAIKSLAKPKSDWEVVSGLRHFNLLITLFIRTRAGSRPTR